MNSIKKFFENLNVIVNNQSIYEEALTHNSFANENRLSRNYQRLEFLGDAIIQLKVSEYLFNKFDKANEGVLTKTRSAVVREESLAIISRSIGLGKLIRLGIGELDSEGYNKDSILSDVYESITAAIYLDSDSESLNNWLSNTLFKEINLNNFLEEVSDYKSELQELIQLEMRNELVYKLFSQQKDNNNQIVFTAHVMIDNMLYGVGKGTSKKRAEQLAAKDALSKIKKSKTQ
ncbi:ribonuclease III [Spiroplasma corruscae]|uniref:Ribonuclease 3 n=1 Tax=Spiroplasma corruscae TaxID=216934 RepID=A0A222ENV0_9MOLU|nr:ribonuclease III [Spiroplasma corruscae]ASP27963.1 ribonuclease III [Spiroplasma corruscae]